MSFLLLQHTLQRVELREQDINVTSDVLAALMGSHGSHDSSAAHALRVTSELEQSQGGPKRSGSVQAAFFGQLGCEVPLCPAVRFSSHRWAQSSAGIPPDMPENLRQIMDDYAAWLATGILCLAESILPAVG